MSEGNRKDYEQNFTVEERQLEVYTMDIQGYEDKEIAEKLDVSISTVEKDLKKIRDEIKSKLQKMEGMRLYQALYDAILQLDLVRNGLWQIYEKEKDSSRKQKLLESIANNAVHKMDLLRNAPKVPTPKEIFRQQIVADL